MLPNFMKINQTYLCPQCRWELYTLVQMHKFIPSVSDKIHHLFQLNKSWEKSVFGIITDHEKEMKNDIRVKGTDGKCIFGVFAEVEDHNVKVP